MKTESALVTAIARSVIDGTRLPEFPQALSQQQADSVARQVAAAVAGGDHPQAFAGLKAGVTDAAVQKHLGLDEALIGHLYPGRRVEEGARLAMHRKALIECELAIQVNKQGRPLAVAPALEFVRLDFARREDLKPANLVATNLGAEAFLIGEARPWCAQTLATLRNEPVLLFRDGTLVFEAALVGSLGGPEAALDWMLGRAEERGWMPTCDTWLLTGTLGQAIPFEAGSWRVEYESLRPIHFRIDEMVR